ncbi:MAG: hypothetical protein PHU63_03045 [Candidatus ainarchaeum sp.]|nr:hypothetical protein [Candidatus ainarchaeum sp.]
MKKEERREISKGRIVISLVISIMLFFGFFTFGYFVAYSVINSNMEKQENLMNSFLELQLQKEIIKSSCDNFNLESFSRDLTRMSEYMSTLEEKLGKNDPQVIEQKEKYSLIEIQHLLLVEEKIERCDTTDQLLVFFCSNEPKDIQRAEDLGYIITKFREKYEGVFVYSFDYNLDMTILETLKKKYGIESPNSVYYNGNSLENIQSIDDFFIKEDNYSEEMISLN